MRPSDRRALQSISIYNSITSTTSCRAVRHSRPRRPADWYLPAFHSLIILTEILRSAQDDNGRRGFPIPVPIPPPMTPKHPSHFAITHRFIPIGSQQETRHPVRCSFHDPCNLFHRRPLFAFHNRFVMDMHRKGQSIPKDDLASNFYLSTFPIIRKSHWIQQDSLRNNHSTWLVLSNNRMACYRVSFHKLHMLNMKYQEQLQFPSV